MPAAGKAGMPARDNTKWVKPTAEGYNSSKDAIQQQQES